MIPKINADAKEINEMTIADEGYPEPERYEQRVEKIAKNVNPKAKYGSAIAAGWNASEYKNVII